MIWEAKKLIWEVKKMIWEAKKLFGRKGTAIEKAHQNKQGRFLQNTAEEVYIQ